MPPESTGACPGQTKNTSPLQVFGTWLQMIDVAVAAVQGGGAAGAGHAVLLVQTLPQLSAPEPPPQVPEQEPLGVQPPPGVPV